MTNTQTIDGVSRKSLEQALKLAAVFDDGGDGADAESARGVVWILRTLLDAHACKTCNGTRIVSDGAMYCSSGGIPFESGPIECVKDCPDCKAAAQPQGVPVAWIKPDVAKTLTKDECCYAFGSQNPKGTLIPLYAEQPAPVSLVLPSRRSWSGIASWKQRAEINAWNACLDEVTRLNGIKP